MVDVPSIQSLLSGETATRAVPCAGAVVPSSASIARLIVCALRIVPSDNSSGLRRLRITSIELGGRYEFEGRQSVGGGPTPGGEKEGFSRRGKEDSGGGAERRGGLGLWGFGNCKRRKLTNHSWLMALMARNSRLRAPPNSAVGRESPV